MNWFKRFTSNPNSTRSILHDESTFYYAFLQDLEQSEKEVIIESPFITSSRMEMLYPAFKRMLDRGIKIHIITRNPSSLDENTGIINV